ncbi:hypothetical protein NX059_012291 [Plenodomus lindquistii]|nr:hypothetical protein NX059_012291 [Plenodomus lindquistii]
MYAPPSPLSAWPTSLWPGVPVLSLNRLGTPSRLLPSNTGGPHTIQALYYGLLRGKAVAAAIVSFACKEARLSRPLSRFYYGIQDNTDEDIDILLCTLASKCPLAPGSGFNTLTKNFYSSYSAISDEAAAGYDEEWNDVVRFLAAITTHLASIQMCVGLSTLAALLPELRLLAFEWLLPRDHVRTVHCSDEGFASLLLSALSSDMNLEICLMGEARDVARAVQKMQAKPSIEEVSLAYGPQIFQELVIFWLSVTSCDLHPFDLPFFVHGNLFGLGFAPAKSLTYFRVWLHSTGYEDGLSRLVQEARNCANALVELKDHDRVRFVLRIFALPEESKFSDRVHRKFKAAHRTMAALTEQLCGDWPVPLRGSTIELHFGRQMVADVDLGFNEVLEDEKWCIPTYIDAGKWEEWKYRYGDVASYPPDSIEEFDTPPPWGLSRHMYAKRVSCEGVVEPAEWD